MRTRFSLRTTGAVLLLLMSPAAAGRVLASATAPAPQTRADRARAISHYQNGWKLFRSESWDEAAREFERAIDLDAKYELAYYGLGRTYMALKRFVEAIQAYRQSRALFLESVGDRFNNQQAMRQRWQDQIRELDELIRISQQGPQTAAARNQTRQLRDQQRRIEQNLEREQGVALDTTVPAFLSLALGSAYFRAEDVTSAEREYKACLEADPQSGEAWNNLAVIYLVTDRIPDAERAVAAAEKTGYRVNPGLKEEIRKRKGVNAFAAGPPRVPSP